MIQRNEKLLNGMIPRKSGRDAISVGKVSQDEQTVAGTRRWGGADWSVKVLGCLRRKEWTCVLCTCSEQCVTPACIIPIPLLGAAPLRTTRHTRQGRGVFTGQSPWPLLFFAALLCFSLLDILISGTATSKSVQLKVENAACLMLKCVDGRQNLKVHFWI